MLSKVLRCFVWSEQLNSHAMCAHCASAAKHVLLMKFASTVLIRLKCDIELLDAMFRKDACCMDLAVAVTQKRLLPLLLWLCRIGLLLPVEWMRNNSCDCE